MAKITTLSCDIETYSSIDLTKCGVYRYCESPDFEVLLFGYCVDGYGFPTVKIAETSINTGYYLGFTVFLICHIIHPP
jgi:hypothetical protein